MARRLALAFAGLAAFVACSSKDTEVPSPDAGAVDTRPKTPPEWDRPVTRPDDAAAAQARATCTFQRGALPDETLGKDVPVGKDLPLETIVILMQENRSFDHYFGHFGKYANRTDVEVAPETATNPTKTGADPGPTVPWTRGEHLCFDDPNHGWTGSHLEYDDGKNDGFVEANGGNAFTMWWFDEKELPYYYALAKAFGLGDHYHCSLLGPTWPNRMFLFSATSFGQTANALAHIDAFPFPANDALVLDELDKRHVDWKLYTDGGPPGAATIVGVQLGTRWGRSVVFTLDDFYRDAKAGTLPPVVYLDANFIATGDPEGQTEHAPSDPQEGQKLTHDLAQALMTSPQWKSLAFFVVYDEGGGIYDHVPPPPACVPDGSKLLDKSGGPEEGAMDRYGFRVPFLVVSPFAKRGYVGHGLYDHSSLLRLVQAKYRLPALTARDANADIPLEFFDFAKPDLSIPDLPDPPIDPAELDYCQKNFR